MKQVLIIIFLSIAGLAAKAQNLTVDTTLHIARSVFKTIKAEYVGPWRYKWTANDTTVLTMDDDGKIVIHGDTALAIKRVIETINRQREEISDYIKMTIAQGDLLQFLNNSTAMFSNPETEKNFNYYSKKYKEELARFEKKYKYRP